MPHCHNLIDDLRSQGYRLTPQREMIIEAIAHSDRHMTAEQVFEAVKTRTQALNIATVYRTLDLLVEENLASRIDVGRDSVLYATCHHGPHIHLACRRCGRVIEADHELIAPLAEKLRSEYGFEAELHHVSLFGVCDACQTEIESQERKTS